MGHWTDEGFVANPVSYYKSAIQQVFIDAFGSDFDLNDNLPQGVLIQRLAELFYAIDMDGIEAFARLNLNTMGGIFLDIVGLWRGINRILGAPQTGVVTVTCNATNFVPFTLPAGVTLTVTETGDQFVTSTLTTFQSETAEVRVQYAENGNSSAIIGNTMTVEGYSQIQNIEITSLFDGTENETDIEYRARIQKEYPAAVGTIEFVNNKLRELPSLKDVNCIYNDSDTPSGDLPAYSTEWIVAPKASVSADAMGVFRKDVAQVILNNKVPGSPTYGTTSEVVTDTLGSTKRVYFTIADAVPIEISITVSTPETTGILDLTAVPEIKEALAGPNGYMANLGIGKDVSYSRCIAPFATSTGFDIVSFKMKAIDWFLGADEIKYWHDRANDRPDALDPTNSLMAWRVEGSDDLFYTIGETMPVQGDAVYNESVTTQVTTVDVPHGFVWVQNANLLIGAKEYATLNADNITVGV